MRFPKFAGLCEQARDDGYAYAQANEDVTSLSDDHLEAIVKRQGLPQDESAFYRNQFFLGFRIQRMGNIVLSRTQCVIIEIVHIRIVYYGDWTTFSDLLEILPAELSEEEIEEAFAGPLLEKDTYGIVRYSPDEEELAWIKKKGIIQLAREIDFS